MELRFADLESSGGCNLNLFILISSFESCMRLCWNFSYLLGVDAAD